MPIYCTKGTTYMYKSDVHTFQLSQVFYHQDRKHNESISIPCVYKKETLDPTFTSIKIQHDVN
mgnify:CR=1 FL=1